MAQAGRNDPCPCGSGLKLKKCHGQQELDDGARMFNLTPLPEPSSRAQENLEQRVRGFLSVPGRVAGCYDLPAFTTFERENPEILDEYARFVVERKQTDEERARVRRLVPDIAARIAASATPAEISRRCLQISYVLLRSLEAAGIWSFVVHGSVGFEFDRSLHLEHSFHWVRDHADTPAATMGHLWVVAPPFRIVDCTVRHQAWQHGEGEHVPSPLLAEQVQEVTPREILYCAPYLRDEVEPPSYSARRRWSWLTPVRVSVEKLVATFQADSIKLPPVEENLPNGFPHLTLGGRAVNEFFDREIRPLL
jgi:hypothetical protein